MIGKMTKEAAIHRLLCVPYNDDYMAEGGIKDILTTEEFFENCFVHPQFHKEIKELLNEGSDEGEPEIDDFEINLEKLELVKRLDRQENEYSLLEQWIKSRQAQIFCIRGDAGTGKTTFLNHLRYKYRNEPIYWNVVDIQKATQEVAFMYYRIQIPDFHSIYSKSIAALLANLTNSLYPKDSDNRIILSDSADIIKRVAKYYRKKFDGYYPREEIKNFFEGLDLREINPKSVCEECAFHIKQWLEGILQEQPISQAYAIILETYVFYAVCANETEHHIIALDNIERFVGPDEIYNAQLTEFVEETRRIQRAIFENNHLSYQLMMFMRNTSVRMFTSRQATELFSHTFDLSCWFDASEILQKKIKWYDSRGIDIEGKDILLAIINDMGSYGDTLRGLHFKISMLFNYNKRLIVRFLMQLIYFPLNESYMNKFRFYWDECKELKPSLNKFAARSIIYRLVLNALREDKFFVHIIEQSGCSEGTDTAFDGTGYARKILSILYLNYLPYEENPHDIERTYIRLDDLVNKLYTSSDNSMQLLLDPANSDRLDRLAQVLFYMNYYDVRRENCLHFVDIQYNHSSNSNIKISNYEQLKKYICENYASIKVRITNAGVAYLNYVVSSFEFFACKSITKKYHTLYFGQKDIPPLLCSVPTVDEIKSNDISSLTCVKTITVVMKEALSCIQGLNGSQNPVGFQAKRYVKPKTHQERIMNAHRGFIDNFIECLRHLYKEAYREDEEFARKFNDFQWELLKLRNQYSVNHGLEEDKK